MWLILNVLVCLIGAVIGICVFTDPMACYWSGAATVFLSLLIWDLSES